MYNSLFGVSINGRITKHSINNIFMLFTTLHDLGYDTSNMAAHSP